MNAILLDDLKHAEELPLARVRRWPRMQRLLERPAGSSSDSSEMVSSGSHNDTT
jgi:hypothetical protein